MEKKINYKNSYRIKVYCNPEEEAKIKAYAKKRGMSTSAYLRHLGMTYVPKSVVNQNTVAELVDVNAELSDLGNQFKRFVNDDYTLKEGLSDEETCQFFEELMTEISVTQNRLLETVKRL